MTRTPVVAALVGGLMLTWLAAGPAPAAPPAPSLEAGVARLVPHRALYRMSLKSARSNSGVVDATGAMQYRIAETCEAWAVETNIYLRLRYAEGDDVNITWSFASVEAKDGLAYRYRMRHARGGEVIESLRGEARLEAPGAEGVARFDEPEGETIKLPAGTLFPTRHLAALIVAAEGGARFFPKAVFDGASLDNPYEINATITARARGDKTTGKDGGKPGAAAGAGKEAGKGGGAGKQAAKDVDRLIRAAGLKHAAVWPVRLAFFPKGSREPEPEFELGVDYRADGVAQRIEQDYGDFAIDMVPGEIEVLERPKC